MLARRVATAAGDDPAAPLRPLAARLAAADLTVGNLESTLSREGAPTQGGDSFGADPAVLEGLEHAGFDALSLANNHLGDYGPAALRTTVTRVARAGITPFGAGANLAVARKPAILRAGGLRFGFLAFNAIGETPAATAASPGAVQLRMPPRTGPLNEGDLAAVQAQIRQLRDRVDVVVVLPHWGDQYTSRPVPAQRTVGRALVDAGADLVVGGHPHVLQGVELRRGKLIAHSLGNFVFDMDFSSRTMEGAFLELSFWGDELKAADLVPYRMDGRFTPRAVEGAAARSVLAPVWPESGAPFSAGR
nr:CapA family protein [Motilibacter aurantiacus]